MADDKKKKISLGGIDNAAEEKGSFMTVSYTHLTLPTTSRV